MIKSTITFQVVSPNCDMSKNLGLDNTRDQCYKSFGLLTNELAYYKVKCMNYFYPSSLDICVEMVRVGRKSLPNLNALAYLAKALLNLQKDL